MKHYISREQLVGIAIRRERERLGVRQSELSKAIGITPSAWCKIELADSPLTISYILTFCDYFNCTFSYLEELFKTTEVTLNEIGIFTTTEVDEEKIPTTQATAALSQYLRTLRKF